MNMLEVVEYQTDGALPDLFRMNDGSVLRDPACWEIRRAELARSAIDLQYGTQPPAPDRLTVQTCYRGEKGDTYRLIAHRGEKSVQFCMHVLRPIPNQAQFPVIIDGDGCFPYQYQTEFVELPRKNGIGLVLFDRTELANDIQHEGRRKGPLYELYPDYTFGAIGAWAWGYSRCVDALLSLGLADPDSITFTGHSRGGKTAMLAGALDTRATIVNPNETCAGACSCYRVSMKAKDLSGSIGRSERLSDLMQNFGFWMGEGMYDYVDRPQDLPFDSHFLKAMVAPRTLFVSEAAHDIWACPLGSWLTTMAAGELFRFLGVEENCLWYFRDGSHSHTAQDMAMLVSLINHKRLGTPLHSDFFRRPFTPPARLDQPRV